MWSFLATDLDGGVDGVISFAITGGNQAEFFDIVESIGSDKSYYEATIVIRKSPILPGKYNLTIAAFDHGSPVRSSSAYLLINVAASSPVDCHLDHYSKWCQVVYVRVLIIFNYGIYACCSLALSPTRCTIHNFTPGDYHLQRQFHRHLALCVLG